MHKCLTYFLIYSKRMINMDLIVKELGLSEDGTSNRDIIAQAVFDASDPNLSRVEQQKRLKDTKRIAQYMEETHRKNKSSDPSKLLTSYQAPPVRNSLELQPTILAST